MLRRLILPALLAVALLAGVTAPADAIPTTPAAVESVSAPTHNETGLTLFTCAAVRNSTGHGTMTINHSHKIAAESTTDPITGQPAIDAYDCEGYVHAGLDGCNYRALYVHDNKADGTDLGIIPTAVRVNCFGF